MGSGNLYVDPTKIGGIGGQLKGVAARADALTDQYFTSQAGAAKGNAGFDTGAKLIDFANKLHTEMNSFITDLSTNAGKIVAASKAYHATETISAGRLRALDKHIAHESDVGLQRELTALTGLTRPPSPGQ